HTGYIRDAHRDGRGRLLGEGAIMNRRTRHIVVLAVAIVTASLASLGVYRATSGLPNASAAPTQIPVVVAARSMSIGTPLTERDVRVIMWPAHGLVPGSIRNFKDIANRGLITAVLE